MKQSHRRTGLKREIISIIHSTKLVDNFARKTFVSLFIMALIQRNCLGRQIQANYLTISKLLIFLIYELN